MDDFRQDDRLNLLRKNRTECTIIVVNGVRIKGTVESFDKYVIMIRGQYGKQSMVYKHAVSTILT